MYPTAPAPCSATSDTNTVPAVHTPQGGWGGTENGCAGTLGCETLTGNLHPAHSMGHWETEQALQSCVEPERWKKRNKLETLSKQSPCEQSVLVSIPVARKCSLHIENPEVSVSASQPGTPLMFVLTATAQPVNLHPVEIKGEAEWETLVPLGDELEGIYNHRKKGFKEKYYTSLSACCNCCISTASPQHPALCGQALGFSGQFNNWLNSTPPHT